MNLAVGQETCQACGHNFLVVARIEVLDFPFFDVDDCEACGEKAARVDVLQVGIDWLEVYQLCEFDAARRLLRLPTLEAATIN